MTDTPQSKREKQLLNEAQMLIYDAWEEPSKKRAIDLAHRALELSADCVDAYLILADLETTTDEEAIALYRTAIEAGRRILGKKAFTEDAGHFWGIHETRPFMRAMDGLASILRYTEGEEEALAIWREMLRLNPNDNQGVRYRLLALLVEINRNEDAEVMMEEGEDFIADWAYARALLAFRREGDTPKSRDLLTAALTKNAHVPQYLLAKKKLPKLHDGFITPGAESEAVSVAESYLPSWHLTPGAVQWLAREAGISLGKALGPRLTPLFPAAEKKKLADLLALAAAPDEALNLEELHGLLFGLAITPAIVKPGEWLPLVFGEQMLAFDNEKKMNRLFETLFDAHGRFIDERDAGKLRFPFNFAKLNVAEVPRVSAWAYGLVLALGLRPDIWGMRDGQFEKMLERQGGSAWAAAVVATVALPEALDEAGAEDEIAATEEEKERLFQTMFEQLPEAVATLIEHAGKRQHPRLVPPAPLQSAKPGRNDLCPCGSGKKYKKCCGS